MSTLIEISNLVNQLPIDLKAETLISSLIDSGLDTNEYIVAFDGQLQRIWSKDVPSANIENLGTGEKLLCFHLNRDGIYDMLPEGLFHGEPDSESHSAEELAKNSLKLRKEESDCRSFFQPFENEIFNQRVQLAITENLLFKSILSKYLMGLIPDFWIIPEGIPDVYVKTMVKLLPIAHLIIGNLAMTAESLEFILNEKVRLRQIRNCVDVEKDYVDFQFGTLGQTQLGMDSVCGDFINGHICNLMVEIGPVRLPETDSLVKDRSMDRFLECFYSYFMPLEFDVETRYISGEKESLFILDDEQFNFSYLGYNSVIM